MTADVLILGCGAMGSAAAWQLGKRGVRTLAIDRFAPPHALGSSHGHTRMTRTAYYEHPDYVPLLLRSHELWRDLERETGQRLLEMAGGIYIGPESSELISGSTRAAREHGLEHEVFSGEDLRRRFPQFAAPRDSVGLHEKLAGYLLVEKCVGSLVHAGLAAGVDLHVGETVLDLEELAGHVRVRTDRATYDAGQVIVSAGAWTSELLRRTAFAKLPKVTPTRQVLGWFWPRESHRFRNIPVWAFDIGSGHLLYGFPMLADRPGLKAALHRPGPATDPNAIDRTISAADELKIRSLLREYIPLAADGPLLHATTCLYENSPDGHFLLGKLSDRITLAAGFSGHGFKFAPVIGEILADLATTGATRHPIRFFAPARFQ